MSRHQLERAKWTDVAVVVLAACSFEASMLQWHVYRGQAAEMKVQTSEMEASGRQTDQLIRVAQASADAATKGAE